MKLPLSAILLTVLLSILGWSGIYAQDTIHITTKSFYSNERVIIRWAPLDISSWRYALANGFQVERKTFREDGLVLSSSNFNASSMLSNPLLVLPESEWESMTDTSDLAGIAAGSIYGDSLDLLPVEGGGLVQIYNKAREVENRFGFSLFAADQDIQIAQAMGLVYTDLVKVNCEYVYFIRALGPAVTTGGFVSVPTDSVTSVPAPSGLRYVPGDKAITLQWNRDENTYSSFMVERAKSVDSEFIRMNEAPLMFASTTGGAEGPMSFTDPLANNTNVYVYRVRGMTPFGLWGPYSDTIQVKGKPAALSFLFSVTQIQEVSVGDMTVTWEFPNDLQGQITGFDVYRSDKVDGVYTKINTNSIGSIAVSLRTFVDANPLPANYYMVKTLDVNGYEYQTFPSLGQPKDDTPPGQPVILSGACNSSGVVTLTWAKSSASDVLGYRVFMSSVSNGDFAQVTETVVSDTVFRYQVETNTLSEEVYFGIKALDLRQNQSVMSTPFLVMRADAIPPAPPVIAKAEALTSGVSFEWTLSSSTDVMSYTLERKEVGMRGWVSIVEYEAESAELEYTDVTASGRARYEYRLVATDDAGLKSSSLIVKIRPIDTGMRHAIQNFDGEYHENYIALEWDYGNDPDLIGFEVFRAIQDSNTQRAYSFIKMPSGQTGSPNLVATATLTGNQWGYTFQDRDLDFSLPQLSTFISSPGLTQNTNASIPAPSNPNATLASYNVSNPNNLSGQSSGTPTRLYYWVMAKYADGGYSPMAGALLVELE